MENRGRGFCVVDEQIIIDHTHPEYVKKWQASGGNKYNGAYWYSVEIVKNIMPLVDTGRNWITVNINGVGCDHAIVFIHNNKNPQNYEHLKRYEDLVLVCGIPETCEKVKHLGKAIYLPLSVDVEEVKKYKTKKTKSTAYVGRRGKRQGLKLPANIKYIENLPRSELLEEMAKHKYVYAVGRTAIEAKILGCKILPYDKRFKDVNRWQVLDNRDAAGILQKKLGRIDK